MSTGRTPSAQPAVSTDAALSRESRSPRATKGCFLKDPLATWAVNLCREMRWSLSTAGRAPCGGM
eukprot:9790685-Lingulodinium_polyedra.AAC.1